MSRSRSASAEWHWAWLVGAGSLGAAAGWPWVILLVGLLPSAAMAAAAILRARMLEGSDPGVGFAWRWVLGAAALGSLIGAFLGFPFGSTWPDCFHLVARVRTPDVGSALIAAGIGGAVVGAGVEMLLQYGWERISGASATSETRPRLLLAGWIAAGALGWSIANETMMPFIGLLMGRDPCNPEVGVIAAALYAAAASVAGRKDRRGGSASRTLAVGCALLCIAQVARSAANVTTAWPQRIEHGGKLDCRCMKMSVDFGSMPMLGAAKRGNPVHCAHAIADR